ncbi:FAD-dependent thymidylate synthase, partial [bacterium]|nr:FAD-dependent thymidylate synthase [bacterium]
AEELLDKRIPVLDKGFVRLVDYLGGDARIVQSARVSYGEGTRTVREDKGLIHYLYRNAHTSPFEQVQLTFHCKLPIFVARQWVRHRTARLNELSGRYSVMRDEFYLPDQNVIRYQSKMNKQGRMEKRKGEHGSLFVLPSSKSVKGRKEKARLARSETVVAYAVDKRILEILKTEQEQAYCDYEEMLGYGIARELARINLPLSLYTEWYWQIDLNNLFHFLKLRLDPHAQYEIHEYAKALAMCAQAVAPLAYEAFEEYGLQGVRFSRREMIVLRKMLKRGGFSEETDISALTKMKGRKREEFIGKIWRKEQQSTEVPDFKPEDRDEEFQI